MDSNRLDFAVIGAAQSFWVKFRITVVWTRSHSSKFCVLPGKTRYGICVNFYRAVDRAAAAGPHRSVLRRESWRKSMEKSSDSAFSRWLQPYLHCIRSIWSIFPYNFISTAYGLNARDRHIIDSWCWKQNTSAIAQPTLFLCVLSNLRGVESSRVL